jgi:ABC-type multidrug transport system ATPase subunit
MQLRITGVSKAFGAHQALDSLSLDIAPGMFGLLGPNGAGKTTLMRVVATLLAPDAGRVTYGDLDVIRDAAAVRALLGYLPQEFGLYPHASVQETLVHFAALKGYATRAAQRAVADHLLHRVNLVDVAPYRVSTLSGGTRQRLGLAIALTGNPRLLVLDEPTAGLDPEERHRLYDVLAELAEDRIVIVSTHIVQDVEELCHRLAIVDRGRLLAVDEPQALVARLQGQVWELDSDATSLGGARRAGSRRMSGRKVTRWIAASAPSPAAIAVPPKLEDAYFAYVASP